MNSLEIINYHDYHGTATRLLDGSVFEVFVFINNKHSLANIADIVNNGCRNGNQDIMIDSLIVNKSDYDEFVKDQSCAKKSGTYLQVKTTINRPNFELKLECEKKDGSMFSIIISSIQFRIDSSEEIDMGNEVSFENVKAIILGGCITRDGGLS